MNRVKLSDIATIRAGGRMRLSGKDFVEAGVPAYGAGGVNGYLPEMEADSDAIILASVGTCGRCYLARGPWVSLANTQVIVPHAEHVDVSFLWHQLNDQKRWPRSGTSQPFIKPSDVKSHLVALPPIREQRRIAAVLDRADEVRAKRLRSLALLDDLANSVFSDMFSEVQEQSELGEVADFYAGGSLPSGEPFQGQQSGYLLMKVSDMNAPGNEREIKGTAAFSMHPGAKSATCPPGSVVIPKRGGAIGTNKKRLTVRSTVLDPNLMGIHPRPGLLDANYLMQWFRQFDLASITSGSSVPQLNKKDLQPLRLPLPSLQQQQAFAQTASAIELARQTLERSQAAVETLVLSLRARAFSGAL